MITRRKLIIGFILYAVIDIFCIAMGMGVPIFCILFGFVVGWYIAKYLCRDIQDIKDKINRIMRYSIVTAGFSFLVMLIIWGRMAVMLGDPATDYENFGIPFILYDPKLSFIGWLILMIFISPFLQLLTMVFAAFLALRNQKLFLNKIQ